MDASEPDATQPAETGDGERKGNFTWMGWQTSAEDAAQPTTGIIFGANLRRDEAEDEVPERESDAVRRLLAMAGLPLTRENYLWLADPDGAPEDLDEMSLPPEIRLR